MELTVKTIKKPEQKQRQALTASPAQRKKDFEAPGKICFDDIHINYHSSEPPECALTLSRQPSLAQPASPVAQLKPYTKKEILALLQNKDINLIESDKILDILALLDCDEPAFRRMLKNAGTGAAAGALIGGIAGATAFGIAKDSLIDTLTGKMLGAIGAGAGAAIGGIAGTVHGINAKPEEEMQELLHFFQTLELKSDELNLILENAQEEQYPQILELLRRLSADWDIKKIDLSTMLIGDGPRNNKKRLRSLADIFPSNGSGRTFLMKFLKTAVNLYGICGYDGIISLLATSTEYVNQSLLYDMELSDQTKYEECAKRLGKMGEFVQSAYGVPSAQPEGTQLVSTGSDPHKGGRHVLKIMRDGNLTGFYKPRSLKIDDSIVGMDGLFAFINSFINNLSEDVQTQFKNLRLPTMAITPVNDQYGTEEAMEKKKHFTEEEAKDYYFQMGMLAAAAEYLGLSDLHQDNIMATAKGPMIIDAEVAFLNQHSGITDALTKNVGQKVGTSSVDGLSADFFIQQAGPSSVTAISNYCSESPDGPCHTAYTEGYRLMKIHMGILIQQSNYIQKLQRQIVPGLSMRIVPLSTAYFADMYVRWLQARENAAAKPSQDTLLSDIAADAIKELKKTLTTGTPLRAISETEITLNANTPTSPIQLLLRTSLDNGDVPCFEVKIRGAAGTGAQGPAYSADILLDEAVIGRVTLHFRRRPVPLDHHGDV